MELLRRGVVPLAGQQLDDMETRGKRDALPALHEGIGISWRRENDVDGLDIVEAGGVPRNVERLERVDSLAKRRRNETAVRTGGVLATPSESVRHLQVGGTH